MDGAITSKESEPRRLRDGRGLRATWNDLEHLDERARPSVRDDEGNWIGPLSFRVDVVDAQPVDVSHKVVELVDAGLLGAPVESILPVLAELADVGEAGAVVPAYVLKLVGPAGAA